MPLLRQRCATDVGSSDAGRSACSTITAADPCTAFLMIRARSPNIGGSVEETYRRVEIARTLGVGIRNESALRYEVPPKIWELHTILPRVG